MTMRVWALLTPSLIMSLHRAKTTSASHAGTGLDLMYHAVRAWYVADKNNTGVYVYDLAKTTEYTCRNIATGDKAVKDLPKTATVETPSIGYALARPSTSPTSLITVLLISPTIMLTSPCTLTSVLLPIVILRPRPLLSMVSSSTMTISSPISPISSMAIPLFTSRLKALSAMVRLGMSTP